MSNNSHEKMIKIISEINEDLVGSVSSIDDGTHYGTTVILRDVFDIIKKSFNELVRLTDKLYDSEYPAAGILNKYVVEEECQKIRDEADELNELNRLKNRKNEECS